MADLLPLVKALILFGLAIAGFVGLLFVLSRGLTFAQPAIENLEREARSLAIGNPLWPTIETADQARFVSKSAAISAFAIAGLQLVAGTVWLRHGPAWWLLDVGMLIAVGFGLLRASRIAAIAGLLLFISAAYVSLKSLVGIGVMLIVAPFGLLAFLHGVRATIRLSQIVGSDSGGPAV